MTGLPPEFNALLLGILARKLSAPPQKGNLPLADAELADDDVWSVAVEVVVARTEEDPDLPF